MENCFSAIVFCSVRRLLCFDTCKVAEVFVFTDDVVKVIISYNTDILAVLEDVTSVFSFGWHEHNGALAAVVISEFGTEYCIRLIGLSVYIYLVGHDIVHAVE